MSAAAPAPGQRAAVPIASGDSASPSPAASRRSDNVVEIHNLHVHFASRLGTVGAVNGVSLDIPRGRVIGVVGESGCGKSVTAFAIMQLVAPPGKITAGQILFHARGRAPVDMLRYDRNSREMRAIRGRHVSMIFQEPMTALNPCYTIGDQITETILLHQTRDRKEADARAANILQRVGLPNPGRLVRMYPHELSGGMRQRAMIALALSCEPDLLLADEPTTALDVTTQAQILDVMRDLQAQIGMAIMFVTHNLGVIAQMADAVAVMYLGRIVEHAPVDELFDEPRHPYTRALMRSIPRLGVARHSRLHVIEGSVPGAYTQVPGCAFHPRCPAAMDGLCNVFEPVLLPVNPDASVACFLYHQPDGTPVAPGAAALYGGASSSVAPPGQHAPPAPTPASDSRAPGATEVQR
jgi:peptide/nickel transport system ATP-binding protein